MHSVKTNMLAWNASRELGITTKKNAKNTEKLSSGYRINRAADDAAGLAISEKMRRQVRGLTQASQNAQDGISMVQSAEGALNEVHDMLHRANELAVKAANGTLTDDDRELIDMEVQQVKKEIDNSAEHTVFNEIRLFPDDGKSPRSASVIEQFHYEMSYNLNDGSYVIDYSQSTAGAGRAGVNAVSSGNALADAIANELIPNAVQQIFAAFPSLKNAVGNDTIQMALDVSYIDGPSNTLAYASYSYYNTAGSKPIEMGIKVDTSDFSEKDIVDGTDSKVEMLKSTIAHEITHSIMQYTLTDGMSGRNGEKYPTWFIEGSAQLSGGGFTTGWNNQLIYYADRLTDADDTSMDANIKNYMQQYSVTGRPYGHGYLATAYAAYKANGGGAVTAAGIAAGMDKIYASLLNGDSLDKALTDNAGISEQDLLTQFARGESDVIKFARELAFQSKGGAGSVVAAALNTGGSQILGTTAGNQAFQIDPTKVNVDLSGGHSSVFLQVGAEAGQHIELTLYQMSAEALGLADTNVKTTSDADDAINAVKAAIKYVSMVRSDYGAIQNRLEHTINNLDNIIENTTSAESLIRDADIADEMLEYSCNQILMQAGASVLSQANHQSEMILSLLG
ncbi:MAG: flagellinolysin [Eubacterium sp.]|nr:flagellinolysin [Eubacterium sp.]